MSGPSRGQEESRALEVQNDTRLQGLAGKVSALRKVTIDIHDEVQDQHGLLEATDQRMGSFGQRLQSTRERFHAVMARTTTRQFFYYVMGVFILLWVLVYLFKSSSQLEHVKDS
ncbi:hypothetical protein IWQ62_004456 [Dispira parvispora]|uniref:t-SNARE coiled-coil homology domain-containing protein n=1 Tax=Dispira parvispora TaxID=1520584 RepID=A0A9W8ASH7_9FUNG|nr:hypothetical protein IWQ62_004456 [Dispira parvispora]